MPKAKQTECFACDGTGQTCNICGESQKACECPEEEVIEYQDDNCMDQFGDCETCKGTGK